MEYDINGSTAVRYTMGFGIDEPISVKTSNATGYYHTDGLGTVREITSSTGAVLNSYSYDAWGNMQSSSETITQPFTFTAREWDSDSTLYYYRARYMDATIGRFTTMDPALGRANNPFSFHGYSYVNNNSVNFIDPNGLSCGPGEIGDLLVPDFWFEECCDAHDDCYGGVPKYEECAQFGYKTREECDEEFKDCMDDKVDELPWYYRWFGAGVAWLYGEAADLFGGSYYEGGEW
jgi:RHS repeat-associated protein